jgi:3-deoxy-D-manno-octulosonic-acid transferase
MRGGSVQAEPPLALNQTMVWYWLYSVALSALAPVAVLYLAARPRYQALLRRFSPTLLPSKASPLWVHACSVGELNAARGLLRALEARFPERARVLTVSTISAMELATSSPPNAEVCWLPFDHPICVRSFLKKLAPVALVIIETELWPSLLRESVRADVPVILVNGRLSDKHFARYSRFRFFFKPFLASLEALGMQSSLYAERAQSLGVDSARITVTGNTKFDGAGVGHRSSADLRREAGFSEAGPVIVFGSTRPGDETLAAACWAEWRTTVPELCFVIAPRHIERAGEAVAAFGEGARLWSERGTVSESTDGRVLILDTVGELVEFYTMATVAIVGGSFYPGVEGHNPIEAAAAGAPVVFGPYMRNFFDASNVLVEGGGALQVESPDCLSAAVARLLTDESTRAIMGEKARETVAANQGAIERTLDIIEPFLSPKASK